MDRGAVLQEVGSWSVEERIRFVQDVWDHLVDNGIEPETTDAQKADLDRRIASLDEAPSHVLTWDEVESHVKRPR